MKTSIKALALAFLISACAEPVSNAATHSPKAQNEEALEIESMAVVYSGRTPLGRSCNLYISQHDSLGYLLKVEHSTHDGHQPSDNTASMVYFKPENGRFYDVSDSPEGATLTLAGIRLKDDHLTPDLNELSQYIQDVQLVQFLKVNFFESANLAEFESALQSVLDSREENLDQLDKISSLDMISLHIDHYHNPSCANFSPELVTMTSFKISHGEDEHNDDDHNHDHD